MSYVIYETTSSKLVKHPSTQTVSYSSERAAKAGRTRTMNDFPDRFSFDKDYAITDINNYYDNIEQFVDVISAYDGKTVIRQSINTPFNCSPASESYWCN